MRMKSKDQIVLESLYSKNILKENDHYVNLNGDVVKRQPEHKMTLGGKANLKGDVVRDEYNNSEDKGNVPPVDWKTQIKSIINETNKNLGDLTRSDDPALKEKATTLYTILQHWANLNIYDSQGSPETRKFVSDQFAISPSPVTKQYADMSEYQQNQMR
jgi:hypothetical protein